MSRWMRRWAPGSSWTSPAGLRCAGSRTSGSHADATRVLGRIRGAGPAVVGAVGRYPALERVVVDLQRLLRRAVLLRYVAQVEPDAGPGTAATAHRVDQDVGRFQQRPDLRVTRLPPVQAGHRLV